MRPFGRAPGGPLKMRGAPQGASEVGRRDPAACATAYALSSFQDFFPGRPSSGGLRHRLCAVVLSGLLSGASGFRRLAPPAMRCRPSGTGNSARERRPLGTGRKAVFACSLPCGCRPSGPSLRVEDRKAVFARSLPCKVPDNTGVSSFACTAGDTPMPLRAHYKHPLRPQRPRAGR